MASELKGLSEYDYNAVPNAKGYRFGIIVTDYHTDITFALLEGAQNALLEHGVLAEDIEVHHVPGTYELPYAARLMQEVQYPGVQAIICLGCVITGETRHDEYINQAVAQGIMQLNLREHDEGSNADCPVIFGVLTPQTHQQAKDRAGGKHGNKGVETAIAAIKMAALRRKIHHDSKEAWEKRLWEINEEMSKEYEDEHTANSDDNDSTPLPF
ncbi:MAG: 6,7-dimethyl-8-ribityllumazine synthase [Chitinophagales bacterium]